jgi:guanylate kinase
VTNGAARGRLVVLAGPSGVGKSTVVKALRPELPSLFFSVSVTTRRPRPGEVEGRDYHFVSEAEFDRMIDSDDLLEWAEIHRGLHRSGTPAAPVAQHLAAGDPVLIEVDLAGARAIKAARSDALMVFLTPPSWDDLVSRLASRGTESPEVVERRLATARDELAARAEFDISVVNDDINRVVPQLVSLLVGAPDGETAVETPAGVSE